MDINQALTMEAWTKEIFRRFPRIWDDILPIVGQDKHKLRTEEALFCDVFAEGERQFSTSLPEYVKFIETLNSYFYRNAGEDLIVTKEQYLLAKGYFKRASKRRNSFDETRAQDVEMNLNKYGRDTGIQLIDQNSTKLKQAKNRLEDAKRCTVSGRTIHDYYVKILGHEPRGKLHEILKIYKLKLNNHMNC